MNNRHQERSQEEIYRSMAIPAMARAPIPATSLLAAPVYLATCGPVDVASTGLPAGPEPEPVATPESAAGVLEAAPGPAGPAGAEVGPAWHVLG